MPQGKVIAFEPNLECRAILLESIQENAISNIEVKSFDLSDEPADLPLYFPKYDSGEGSFAGENTFDITEERIVIARVEVGDVILRDEGIALIKIDVEGFELCVLRGLIEALEIKRPLLIIEIAKKHLARAGATPNDVFTLLHSKGYLGAKLRHRKTKYGLTYTLERLDDGLVSYDSFWAHSSNPTANDFAGLSLNPSKGL